MESQEMGTCEVCGKPATSIVVDLKEVYDPHFRQWEPHSQHKFCDEHKRPSLRYSVLGRIQESI